MEKKSRLFEGNREQDIYDVCEEKRPIDIKGDEDEWLRLNASLIIHEITDDPLDHKIADLILDYGYTEKEAAGILSISPSRMDRQGMVKPRGASEEVKKEKWDCFLELQNGLIRLRSRNSFELASHYVYPEPPIHSIKIGMIPLK